jgi:hypothetical protein
MAAILPPLCGRREARRRAAPTQSRQALRPSPRSRSSRASCVTSSSHPSHLPLLPPVAAKRYSRSTKPTSAWARRRRARSSGVCRPFAPVQCRLKSSPQTGRPKALDPGEPLRRSRTPPSAGCLDRAQPRHALLRTAAAGLGGVLGEPPALRASSGRRRRARGERWQRGGKCLLNCLSVRCGALPVHRQSCVGLPVPGPLRLERQNQGSADTVPGIPLAVKFSQIASCLVQTCFVAGKENNNGNVLVQILGIDLTMEIVLSKGHGTPKGTPWPTQGQLCQRHWLSSRGCLREYCQVSCSSLQPSYHVPHDNFSITEHLAKRPTSPIRIHCSL